MLHSLAASSVNWFVLYRKWNTVKPLYKGQKKVAIVKRRLLWTGFKQELMYGFFVSWDEKKVAAVENRPLAEVQVYHIITAYFSLPSPVTTILLLSGDHAISFMGPLRGWYSYFSKCSSCVVSQILSFPETSETWMLFQQINPFILGKLAEIPSLKLFKLLSFFSRIKPNFKKSFLAYKTSQVTNWLELSGAQDFGQMDFDWKTKTTWNQNHLC